MKESRAWICDMPVTNRETGILDRGLTGPDLDRGNCWRAAWPQPLGEQLDDRYMISPRPPLEQPGDPPVMPRWSSAVADDKRDLASGRVKEF
jgi:hypothetical protein